MIQRAPLEEPLPIFSVGIELMLQKPLVAVIPRGTNDIIVLYPSTERTKEIRPNDYSINTPMHSVMQLSRSALRMHQQPEQGTMKILRDRRVKDWQGKNTYWIKACRRKRKG